MALATILEGSLGEVLAERRVGAAFSFTGASGPIYIKGKSIKPHLTLPEPGKTRLRTRPSDGKTLIRIRESEIIE